MSTPYLTACKTEQRRRHEINQSPSKPIGIYLSTNPEKGHEECRRDRIKAHLPASKMTRRAFGRSLRPVVSGQLLAQRKPLNSVHIGRKIGEAKMSEAKSLYAGLRIRLLPRLQENPFSDGDAVVINKGKFAELRAKVTEIRGRTCIVAFDMLGKQHQQAIAYTQLRPG